MSNKRIAWIDICRGIGILSVIYAHGLSEDKFRFIFYAFHIPLFFFLSGITLHHKQHESTLKSLKKAVKGVLLPYFIFALISYGIWLFLNFSFPRLQGSLQIFINILYGNGSGKQFFYNSVLWFLPCLFITRFIFSMLTHAIRSQKVLILVLSLFSITGYVLATTLPQLKLPFGFETALSGIVFFGWGYFYNSTKKLRDVIENKKVLLSIVFTGLLLLFAAGNFLLTGHQVDMRYNRMGNYFLFYLGAFSGIGLCLSLSYLIQQNKVLEYLGKNSMMLFIWHLIIFSYISKVLFIWITPATISHFRNLYFAPLYSVISIVIISSILMIYQKIKYNQ